ncbi:MAG: tRNA-guanine transglycosylase [Candidatus Peribacteria bacterium]|nr:MAG: tRNA-guanine transglycosylase [Candidatus Peribacteria bacterium]
MHKLQHRDKLILTDSGGFQVFSLGLGKEVPLFKLHPDGVSFSSPHDGSKHKFTPTGVVDIQRKL